MYNRILNRPMFKLGGQTNDAQGTGITSGLDTPRSNYVGGGTIGGGAFTGTPMGNRTGFENIYPVPKPEVPFEAKIRAARNKLRVDPKDYQQATWEGVGAGFGDPNTKTLSEALYKANMIRREGIKPLEASVAQQKHELSKMPFELEMGVKVAEAGKRQLDVHAKKDISDQADKIYSQALIDYKDSEIPQHIKDKYKSLKQLSLGDAFYSVERAMELAEKIYGTEQILGAWTVQQIKDAKADFIALMTGRRYETEAMKKKREGGATGGRIGYQDGLGPNIMQTSLQENIKMPGEDVAISEQIDEANVPVTESQGSGLGENSQAYALLRARLPQEITDDIVRLIAYNPQAFEDFAAIQTQSDVMSFNMKYGVELVIPAQEV